MAYLRVGDEKEEALLIKESLFVLWAVVRRDPINGTSFAISGSSK
jgi:hypothetical protein